VESVLGGLHQVLAVTAASDMIDSSRDWIASIESIVGWDFKAEGQDNLFSGIFRSSGMFGIDCGIDCLLLVGEEDIIQINECDTS
jgi:hypothetical protein